MRGIAERDDDDVVKDQQEPLADRLKVRVDQTFEARQELIDPNLATEVTLYL